MDDIPKFDPSKAAIEDFDPEFASPAQWARLYRRRGMQVVPARMFSEVSQGKSWKCPLFNSWAKLQEELVTDEKFNEWYGPGGKYISRLNMGIITGHASGNLLVIDLDDHKTSAAAAWWSSRLAIHNNGLDLETLEQRTGGGGRQKLFRAPASWQCPTNRTPIGVDVRGQGGFAMIAPSMHESGKPYEWLEGRSPQDIEIMMAPDWLLDEVTKLVAEHGGGGGGEGINGSGGRQRTASPGSAPKGGSDYDAFGNKCDGREAYMRDLIWGAIVDWYRECPIKPGIEDQQKKAEEKYLIYERGVVPRTIDASLTKTQLLDKEGRGPEAFWEKWQHAMRRWDTKVAQEAAKPRPGTDNEEKSNSTGANPGTGNPNAASPPPRQSLADVHAVFTKWFGAEYDLDAATAAMAAAASERLPGDPLWLLIVAGPGGAKTETVQALAGCGAHITSTISSEGALLSATPRKQRQKTATGGLLRKIGDHGTLVIKDFTSILSADRNTRASVLAAIREVYDGRWERNVGTDGGQTLTWTGRIVIVAAVTTAWDAAHAVVATMGDRFALLRLRTAAGRREAGRGAIRNTGGEAGMRQELADAVGGLIEHMDTTVYQLSDDETEQVVKVADLVTLARSAVERDYRGDIEFAHDPEAPTRFAKQLVQLLRGAVAIGVTPSEAMRLVRRCACDSIPPLRRDILLDLAENPGSRAADVRKRISQPRNTVRRGLECLHMLGALVCEETEETDRNGKEHTVWRYRLADEFDEDTLLGMTGPQAGPGM